MPYNNPVFNLMGKIPPRNFIVVIVKKFLLQEEFFIYIDEEFQNTFNFFIMSSHL